MAVLEHKCELPPLISNRKTLGCSMFWWGRPCRNQLTELCHYLPEVPSPTKANASMANPMQGKWVCNTCCMALCAAGLASCARNDAAEAARLQAERDAVVQASRQALLSDLRRATSAVQIRYLRLRAAEVQRATAKAAQSQQAAGASGQSGYRAGCSVCCGSTGHVCRARIYAQRGAERGHGPE